MRPYLAWGLFLGCALATLNSAAQQGGFGFSFQGLGWLLLGLSVSSLVLVSWIEDAVLLRMRGAIRSASRGL